MLIRILLITFSVSTLTILQAQDLYTGVWRSGNSGTFMWAGVEWKDFKSKWQSLAGDNLRLTDIETYKVGNKRYYSGVWEEGKYGYALTPPGLDWKEFTAFWTEHSKTLRLIDIEAYTEDGKRYYLGVFNEGSDGHYLTPLGKDWKAFNEDWVTNSKTLRLIDIETFKEGNKRYFLGVYRQGSGGHVLSPYGKNWKEFADYWDARAKENLRLIDVESYEENGKRIFLGVWRQGTDGYSLVHHVDFESLTSSYAEGNAHNLRLIDLETFNSECPAHCLNQALLPDDPANSGRESYDYGIPRGKMHCEGNPDECRTPWIAGTNVTYRWPNLQVGGTAYLRNSVMFQKKDQIFRLPFKVASKDMRPIFGWMYESGSWHHAIDYWRQDQKTFEILAAAKGKVIYKGWDRWSGNTLVMSHDVGTKKDVYRTIYMHLQNGAEADCNISWDEPITWGTTQKDIDAKNAYEDRLKNSGCPSKKADRNPTEEYWGKESHKIDENIVGKTFNAGERIAYAGRTGPGGQNAIHLHIFFAQRDATTNEWYLFDPYGIYAYGDCYPSTVDGGSKNSCARYPVAWKNGKPGYQ